MKKLLVLILTTVITLSLNLSPAYAVETEYEKVISEVNQTNAEIDKMISQAINEAEKAMERYIKEIDDLNKEKDEFDDKISELENYLEEAKKELNYLGDGSKKHIKIKFIINKLEEKIDRSDEKIDELTEKLDNKIEKIIDKLINNTNRKSAKMIERAADKGYVVVCDMVEVEIGGQVILIDPLRILDF